MSRPIPAFDPRGSRAERTGFIRTESVRLPTSDRAGEMEDSGITLWAGPKALIINAVFPGIDLNELQIHVTGSRLVFSGPSPPDTAIEKPGRRRVRRTTKIFNHSVELPYTVDAARAEVRKEKGLISITLKKDESGTRVDNARLESSIVNSMKRYFGESGPVQNTRVDEYRILQSLDKYFEYIARGDNALSGRTE